MKYKVKYLYFSGEEIELGDKIRDDTGSIGTITHILFPDDPESKLVNCTEGGIITETIWNGHRRSRIWTLPDGENWEDLEFIGRNQVKNQ